MEWWRRWSGSIERRAIARLAARLRSFAGGMPASAGSFLTGEGCKGPVIIRRVQLRLTSNRLVCLLLLHVGAQYSVGAYTSARAEVRSIDGLAPHPVPTSLRMSVLRAMTLYLMQPMGTMNSPSSGVVKNSTPSRRLILRCIDFGIGESSPN